MNLPLRRNSGSARVPLLCLIAAVGGAGAMFVVTQKDKAALQAELAALREQARQAEAKSADPKEVEKLRAQVREAAEFKKEAEEVHRLRSEVTLLRKEKAVFEEASVENAQLRTQAQLAQKLQADNNALRGQNQALSQAQMAALGIGQFAGAAGDVARKNSCIANLKQIDRAIQQWALENAKQATSPVEMRGVLPYLRGSMLPVCPAGGKYTEGPTVSASPTCLIPGHTL